MAYFLILSGEDGIEVMELTANDVQRLLAPDARGDCYYGDVRFLPAIPANDKGWWMDPHENAAVLIQGEIVVPRAVEVVKKYEGDW